MNSFTCCTHGLLICQKYYIPRRRSVKRSLSCFLFRLSFFTTPPFFPGKLAIASGLGFLPPPILVVSFFSRRGKLICWLHSAFSKLFYFGSKKKVHHNKLSITWKKEQVVFSLPSPHRKLLSHTFLRAPSISSCVFGRWATGVSIFFFLSPFCCL